ncbi:MULTISPECIES: hypothetical protein [unclassified Streptomyces]|uniref:hypothetical protein n=1 Tax=unclassified Streptomyces TaxID=2593676 RepID=UPI00370129BC
MAGMAAGDRRAADAARGGHARHQYAFHYRTGILLGILFAGAQSVSLVVALHRPVPAWWTSLLVMVAVTPFAANAHQGDVFPSNSVPMAGRPRRPGLPPGRGLRRPAGRVAVPAGPAGTAPDRRRGATITVLAGLGCVAGIPRPGGDLRLALLVLVTTVVVGAAPGGLGVARTRLVVQEERTAEERARRALLEERNRIARELHVAPGPLAHPWPGRTAIDWTNGPVDRPSVEPRSSGVL